MHPLPAVLAIDGGNSKTDLVLLSTDGNVHGAVRWSSLSHQVLGVGGAVAAMTSAIDRVCDVAGVPRTRPVARLGMFCLAGLDLPVDDRDVGRALEGERFVEQLVLRNDTFAVLRAGSAGHWGVAAVCGAGMNCVGAAPGGEWLRFPALGPISGDWAGGGHWLGLRALGAAVRADDGRGPATVLRDVVPACYGLSSPDSVTEAIYTGKLSKRRLVELGRPVSQTAAEGDAVATHLLYEVADELVAMVDATVVRLGLADLEVPVVLGGGIFDGPGGLFAARVRDGILRAAPRADLRRLDAPPVVGAALLGLDAVGRSPEAEQAVRAGLENRTFSDARSGER